MERLSLMLPSLSNLHLIFIVMHWKLDSTTLSTLPLTNLRKLNVICIWRCPIITQKASLITHLTLNFCELGDINNRFTYIPMLKYLKVKLWSNSLTYELTQIITIAVWLT
jgi:hypothetical protein